MKHLTILVPDGQGDTLSSVSSIAGTHEVFTKANEFWQATGRDALFSIQVAGVSAEVDFGKGLFAVRPQLHIAAIAKTDLIIIPSLPHDYQKDDAGNGELIDWLKHHYRQGAEIASICTGAFMLAETGLLDGRNCSIHWAAADTFRELFPKVNLQIDKLIIHEKGVYTNGGAFSFLNLLLYLVEKYYDRETAIFCSKTFQIELDRVTQSVFTIFTGQKLHGDEMVRKAQAYLEDNSREKISVEQLSALFAVGRRNFDRRFIKATGNTPVEYAQRVKIELAKKEFETSRKTVNEVMYEVGYADAKAFREVFKRITGLSPVEYIGRYNKDAKT